LTFEGLQYEDLLVEAVLPDGRRRTYSLSAPFAGHALSINLDAIEYADNGTGDPTEGSVQGALMELLADRE
jgi:hypothetical protein